VNSLAKYVAEYIGTAFLVAVVVGSGLMAQSLSGDVLVVLLANAIATVFGLAVLIAVLMPVSGSQFNPIVSLALSLSGQQSFGRTIKFTLTQLLGGVSGTMLAHLMFGKELLELSSKQRDGLGLAIGEVVASFGLVFIILLLIHQKRSQLIPLIVPAWIGAGYFFTSSTSFANPAVTLARIFTESFTGIQPSSALVFIGCQILGMGLAVAVARLAGLRR
jgi:glycerol uptake facilitator-like aquaporin